MSKPLRINGVRHTLVEKWLLLSPWEYPRLLSNVPGSDYASEVFSYQTLCMNHPADYSLDIDTDFRESPWLISCAKCTEMFFVYFFHIFSKQASSGKIFKIQIKCEKLHARLQGFMQKFADFIKKCL